MRIIAGSHRGRKLRPIRGMTIRPTSDKAREAIFSILSDSVRNAVVLDLFAGTGALGMEALSRGAASAVFVDRLPQALTAISENLRAFGLEARAEIVKWNIEINLKCLSRFAEPFTLIFMDPPYHKGLVDKALAHLERYAHLAPEARIVVEHGENELPKERSGLFAKEATRRYGKSIVSFLTYDIERL